MYQHINIWNYECTLRIMSMLDIAHIKKKKKVPHREYEVRGRFLWKWGGNREDPAARSIPSLAPQQTPLYLPPETLFPWELGSVTPYLLPQAAVPCHQRTDRRCSWCEQSKYSLCTTAILGASTAGSQEQRWALQGLGSPRCFSPGTPSHRITPLAHGSRYYHGAKEQWHLCIFVSVKGIHKGQ